MISTAEQEAIKRLRFGGVGRSDIATLVKLVDTQAAMITERDHALGSVADKYRDLGPHQFRTWLQARCLQSHCLGNT